MLDGDVLEGEEIYFPFLVSTIFSKSGVIDKLFLLLNIFFIVDAEILLVLRGNSFFGTLICVWEELYIFDCNVIDGLEFLNPDLHKSMVKVPFILRIVPGLFVKESKTAMLAKKLEFDSSFVVFDLTKHYLTLVKCLRSFSYHHVIKLFVLFFNIFKLSISWVHPGRQKLLNCELEIILNT